ncbi:MAG: DUF2312 domain-containing protein [Alphaproteobacteria bacterium]
MADGNQSGSIAKEKLKSFIERIERLEEEKGSLTADIREVYSEAKGNGFEPKVMRKLVSLRRLDKDERQEQDSLLEVYREALGI